MARYLTEFEISSEGFAAYVKSPSDRFKALEPAYAALGGKLEAFYLQVGGSRGYTVSSWPGDDPTNAEALTIAVMATGVLTSVKLVQIITAEEAVAAMEKAGSALYRPPSE
jgi:uncharacterized protein with GYD domain